MKTLIKLSACSIILSTVIFVVNLSAQNPLEGQRLIAKSAEAFLFELTEKDDFRFRTYNFSDSDFKVDQWQTEQLISPQSDWGSVDVVTADLDGDFKDEIVTVQQIYTDQVRIFVYQANENNTDLLWYSQIIFCETNKLFPTTRLIPGNFVGDANMDFAFVYIGTDAKFHVEIYEALGEGEQMTIAQRYRNSSIGIAGKEKDNNELSLIGDQFDVAAINYDSDHYDEIVMIHKLDYDDNANHTQREFYFRAISFNTEPGESILTYKISDFEKIKLNFGDRQGYYNDYIHRIGRPSLASGDVDRDGREELVFGCIVSQYRMPFLYGYSDIYPLQILEVTPTGQVTGSTVLPQPPDPLYVIGSFYQSGFSNLTALNRMKFSLNIECVDFEDDGVIEIICNSPDSLHILYVHIDANGQEMELKERAKMPFSDQRYWDHRCAFAIADVNMDTSQSKFSKEIVYVNYLPTPKDQWGQSHIDEARLGIATLEVDNLHEIQSYAIQSGSYARENKLRYILALGDFDGDGLRLGNPDSTRKHFPSQPMIILNAPPIHYDVINSDTFDVCQAFKPYENKFWATYRKETTETTEFKSTIMQDWSLSSHLKAKYKFCSAGIELTLKQRYGENFKYINGKSVTRTIKEAMTASNEDLIIYMNADFDFWEYPVLFDGKQIGNMLITVPVGFSQKKGSTDYWTDDAYIPNHNLGNILSYKNYANIADNPDALESLDLSSISSGVTTIILDRSSTFDESYIFRDIKSDEFELGYKMGFGINVLASVGYEGKGEGWSVEASLESGLEATYDFSEMRNFHTELSKEEGFFIHFDRLNDGMGDTGYEVKPYMYQSKSGALVLDYAIQPLALVNGNSGGKQTFWDIHYGSLPDLAFILPWLHEPAENLTDKTSRFQTREIVFIPQDPSPGDTVTIVTRIHNYSLKDLPNSNIIIRYYIGDPDADGKLITGLNGETEIKKDTTLAARDEIYFFMDWIVPSGTSADARLYAKIDPDNTIEEIHENNNKGWVPIGKLGTPVFAGESTVTQQVDYSLWQNFPNPFNPSTRIVFSIPKSETVKIEIFNVLGQKVETLLNERIAAGVHEVEFTAKSLSSSLYFYRITAGDFTSVKKMMILR